MFASSVDPLGREKVPHAVLGRSEVLIPFWSNYPPAELGSDKASIGRRCQYKMLLFPAEWFPCSGFPVSAQADPQQVVVFGTKFPIGVTVCTPNSLNRIHPASRQLTKMESATSVQNSLSTLEIAQVGLLLLGTASLRAQLFL